MSEPIEDSEPTEDIERTEDFAAMFEASTKAKRFEKGQTIEGTIVAIGPDVAFIDVGGKGEATIEIAELKAWLQRQLAGNMANQQSGNPAAQEDGKTAMRQPGNPAKRQRGNAK